MEETEEVDLMQKIEELARRLYEAYADMQNWEESGKQGMMLGFPELGERKRRRWILLALDAHRIGVEEEED